MPTEVRLMCGSCGLPQAAGLRCLGCGAALPGSPAPLPNTVMADETFRGPRGWRYVLGGRTLECRRFGRARRRVELSDLAAVQLERRWVLEALGFAAVGFLGVLALHPVWAKVLAWALVNVATLAGLGLFRAALVLVDRAGQRTKLPLGTVWPRTRRGGLRLQSWRALLSGMQARGVQVQPGRHAR